jgi:lipid II:glycine glycyltransferase (peptidoglycan interpeptide bridge formation enzyme)
MNEVAWDAALQELGGNLLQSWRWGAFKELQGWTVARLHGCSAAGKWQAQVLFKRMAAVSLAYIPCGPTMSGNHAAIFPEMMKEIDAACREMRAISLIMEPNQRFELEGTFKQHGFVRWMEPIQPRETMSVPIHDDETMLARMHHKTRYHVRLAQRHGVVTEPRPADPAAIKQFHELHAETAARSPISDLPIDYFTDLLAAFDDRATLVFSIADGIPASGALLARFGKETSYLFAGSSKETRGQGAGAAMVFRCLQWARENGSDVLDMGGVVNAPKLRAFKAGCGAYDNFYPMPMERRYSPLLSFGARRVLASTRP